MRMLILACAIVVGACAQGAPSATAGQTASVRGCHAVATAPWRPPSGVEFTVEAVSTGPTCEQAVATIAIRASDGAVLWVDSGASARLFTLQYARDVDAMQAALLEWITQGMETFASTRALPVWPQGAESPEAGEFPFYVEQWFDRDSYEAVRARGTPVFCYVQGMESLSCVALGNGRIEKIGVQSFPG